MFLLLGNLIAQSKPQSKPNCPPKPSDLAQRVRNQIALTNVEQSKFTPGQKTDVTQAMCLLPSQDHPSPTNRTLNGSFDDLDIPYIDEDEDENLTPAYSHKL